MKKLTVLLLFPLLLLSLEPKPALLKIQAKLYPKIIFFDQAYREKFIEERINFSIAYCPNLKYRADIFNQILHDTYPNVINGIPLKVQTVSLENITPQYKTTALYIVCGCEVPQTKLDSIHGQTRITFACNQDQLKNGAMIGLNVTNRVRPVINKKTLLKYPIKFQSTFTQISEVFHAD